MTKHESCHLSARLRWLRKKYDLSLETMARRLAITTSYLSKLETGKSENPSELLLSMICQTYSVRRDWLMRGDGSPFEAEFLNRAAETGKVTDWKGPPIPLTIQERAKELGLFIAALLMAGGQESSDFLMKTLRQVLSNPLALPAVTVEVARLVAEQLEFALRTKVACTRPLPEVRTLHSVLAEGTIARASYDRLVQDALGGVEVGWVEKRLLTDIHEYVNNVSVKPQMANLLARLQSATKERGKKTELAAYLKVPLASVSQWLSGEREPGGETTLRLLHWVQRAEAQQTKNPGSASTRPGQKTRVRRSSYEKRIRIRSKG